MKPYSLDLRQKIVRSLQGNDTQEEVADRFAVSLSFVEKLWRRWRSTGSCQALPHAGGRRRSLAKHTDLISKEVANQPDITLAELCERVVAAGAPQVSLALMCLELQRLDLPREGGSSSNLAESFVTYF